MHNVLAIDGALLKTTERPACSPLTDVCGCAFICKMSF